MAKYRVQDCIRDCEISIDVEPRQTIADVIEGIVSENSLPRCKTDETAIEYQLLRQGDPQPIPPAETFADLSMSEDAILELISPPAKVVWQRIQQLVTVVNDKAKRSAGAIETAARDEVGAAAERSKTAVENEVRTAIREATGAIEDEAARRVRGLGHRISLWAQLKIRREARALAVTGALPIEMARLSSATGQLAVVTQSALLAPVVVSLTAAVIMATGTAAIALKSASDAQFTARTAQFTARTARSTARTAQSTARTAQATADTAQTTADTAWTTADTARTTADLAQKTADEHDKRDSDVHDEPILRIADDRIDSRLSASYELKQEVRSTVASGASLWTIAREALKGDAQYRHDCGSEHYVDNPTNRQIARYVSQLWLANVGVIGADPNAIETSDEFQLVCPSALEQ